MTDGAFGNEAQNARTHSILVRRTTEEIPEKRFDCEIRALNDIKNFSRRPIVLFHQEETTAKDICTAMLQKILSKEPSQLKIMDEVMDSLFSEYLILSDIIQGGEINVDMKCEYNSNWVCAMCKVPVVDKSYVAIASLKHPVNMGPMLERVKILVLVLAPCKEKCTKNSLEVGRTFATLLQDQAFQQRIMNSVNEVEIQKLILDHAEMLASQVSIRPQMNEAFKEEPDQHRCFIGDGIRTDLQRRLPFYVSDYIDGFIGHHTLHKTISTVFFLYFGCILPTIAFGSLHNSNTHGAIDVKKCIVAQTFGGLFFAILGGQPLVIIMTTAPLSIYIKVVYNISQALETDFSALYACVGLWNTFFLLLYSILGASKMMKWCTRSTEEIFSLFIALAFLVDSSKSAYKDFQEHYLAPECSSLNSVPQENNATVISLRNNSLDCRRDASLLHIILMLGTVWLGLTLFNFKKTPYMKARKREILSDYALPISVIVLSFIGSFVFRKVQTERFAYNSDNVLDLAPLEKLPWIAIVASAGLGFALSLLFFMDQNISAAMVNNSSNRLHKGPAYHLDLLVVGIINAFLSLFGLPWMHGVLPHSPLHARRLADVEDRLDQGHVYEVVVRSRETRVTGIFSHILIGLSLFMLPYPLAYIPNAVLDGLFLYMAATSLGDNQMFERFLLFFTEQASYPPNYYIRQCPQRDIHKFTISQILQLLVLCVFGFYPIPYVCMIFPLVIFLLVPLRYKILPFIINPKYLNILDTTHK